jgi:hypothetical protein
VLEVHDGRVFMGLGLRNAGAGLAVLHGWYAQPYEREMMRVQPEIDEFHPQQLDLYIPAGGDGFWQGAVRDHADQHYRALCAAAESGGRIMIDLMYGDHEGGQRAIARFSLVVADDGQGRFANVLRYWNLDYGDPRERDA